ncbi:unnamed protein product [Sympodiomycopsis kandeliae]
MTAHNPASSSSTSSTAASTEHVAGPSVPKTLPQSGSLSSVADGNAMDALSIGGPKDHASKSPQTLSMSPPSMTTPSHGQSVATNSSTPHSSQSNASNRVPSSGQTSQGFPSLSGSFVPASTSTITSDASPSSPSSAAPTSTSGPSQQNNNAAPLSNSGSNVSLPQPRDPASDSKKQPSESNAPPMTPSNSTPKPKSPIVSPSGEPSAHEKDSKQSVTETHQYDESSTASQDPTSSFSDISVPISGLRPSESTPLKRLSELSSSSNRSSTSSSLAGGQGAAFTPIRRSENYSTWQGKPGETSQSMSQRDSYIPPPLKIVDYAFDATDPRRVGARDVSASASGQSQNFGGSSSSSVASGSSSRYGSSMGGFQPRFRFRPMVDESGNDGMAEANDTDYYYGEDGEAEEDDDDDDDLALPAQQQLRQQGNRNRFGPGVVADSSSDVRGSQIDDDWGPGMRYDEDEEFEGAGSGQQSDDGHHQASEAAAPRIGRYKVLYDFESESEHELTVVAGEIVRVVGTVDGGWAVGFKEDGKEGLVPEGYLEWLSE